MPLLRSVSTEDVVKHCIEFYEKLHWFNSTLNIHILDYAFIKLVQFQCSDMHDEIPTTMNCSKAISAEVNGLCIIVVTQ